MPWIRIAAVAGLLASAAHAQTALTLQQAVDSTLQRYPAVRVSEAEVRNAAAAIQLARTAYLPSISGIAGVNRATRNNVLGLLLPSQVLAPISGPVLGTNGMASAWGSTVGVLANWEPFDFGLRKAGVAIAEAGKVRAEASVQRTKLDTAIVVADTVLTIVAAEQTTIAAQAAVARAGELRRITEALVNAELRPGTELSLAEGEQTAAQVQLIRSRQAVEEGKAVLAAFLGVDRSAVSIQAGQLLTVAEPSRQPGAIAGNPAAREQNAAAEIAEARLKALDRSYFPRFALQGTTYARGTGALPDGRLLGALNGLGPTTQNWAIGFTASFNILDYAAIRARRSAETSQLEAEKAKYDQVLLDLRARQAKAQAAFEGAAEIARVAPAAIAAARAGDEQARARYQAGLGTALEVADAQRRLAQAEIDDSLARLSMWRAKLAVAAAAGDLGPVLAEASR